MLPGQNSAERTTRLVICTLGLINKNPSSFGPKKLHKDVILHEGRICENAKKQHEIVVTSSSSESS